jgi:murein DD-endopeptidase MepM/ murein hydrolase activator NlpD
MNYKILAFLMTLFCQPFFGLLFQNSAEALPPEALAPCAFGISASSKNSDYAPGASWTTCNGYKFIFQKEDRNVVLYSPSGIALWATGTNNYKADKFSIQSDGNVVLYEGNRAVWASNTSRNPGSLFVVQSDGNVVVYNPSGRPIFNTGTNGNRKSTLSASRTWLTRYIPGLLSWSEEEWDKQSGDSFHFDGDLKTVVAKTGIAETSPELKQVSKDLSRELLGSEISMSNGYAYDVNPYYNATTISHAGIDYAAPVGQKVFAVVPGKVVNITEDNPGKFITVESEDGKRWIYGHIDSRKTINSTVTAGEEIGTVAYQTNYHFHIEVHVPPFNDSSIAGGIPYQTRGEFNFVLSKTISPLQAYWGWRNR